MAHNGRDTKIKMLRLKIKQYQEIVPDKKKLMVEAGFSLESIKSYNRALTDVSILKEQLKDLIKYNKPRQYMEEVIIPKNIYF